MGNVQLPNEAERPSLRYDAQVEANKHKDAYGAGVSSQLALVNNSNKELVYHSDAHKSGRWEVKATTLSPNSAQGFLHAKSDSAAKGSTGAVTYTFTEKGSTYYVTFAWSTPYSGGTNLGRVEFSSTPTQASSILAAGFGGAKTSGNAKLSTLIGSTVSANFTVGAS